MDNYPYWVKLLFGVVVALMMSPTACKLDQRFLKKQPCDVHENIANGTVDFNCRGRRLEKVPEIFDNTTRLDLSENRIINLTVTDIGKLKNLTYLNLNMMNNKLRVHFEPGVFVNLTSLQKLQVNEVGLTDILEQLPKTLTSLSLVENKIVSVKASSFLNLTALTTLNLSKNCYYYNTCSKVTKIENGSFLNLNRLEELNLSFNNLTHVPGGLPVSLNILELASNSLAYIGEDDLKQLWNLSVLNIQGNCPRCNNAPYPCVKCKNISIEIHERAFESLQNLKILHLAGNSLFHLKKAWFDNMTNLQELYLSYNFLMEAIEHGQIWSSFPKLKKLDLSFNYNLKLYPRTVKLAPSFANLTSLQTLHIQGLVFKEIENDSLLPLYSLQNLSILDIGTNFIVHDNSNFSQFQNLKLLYLSENRLYPTTSTKDKMLGGSLGSHQLTLPALMGNNPEKEQHYDESYMHVQPECFNAGRVLDLSRNNLFFISPSQFVGYENISCLNLSRNGFAAAPNGTEFKLLPQLKYLDLSNNKIDLAYDYAFKELKWLEVLDLSFNPHYFTVSGVTHNLNFLKNLPKLRVLNMSSNSIFTLTTKKMYSESLTELQFQNNKLGRLWKEKDGTYDKLFYSLKNLTHLDISHNSLYEIPSRVYNFLPVKLRKFCLSHNELTSFNWTAMKRFTQLEELVLSYNSLVNVSYINISENLPYLRYLDLYHNMITQLTDNFLKGAKNLQYLDLSHNRLAVINLSPTLEYHPSTLSLDRNPFHCTCKILDFIKWIENSTVKIPKLATSVTCYTPESIRGRAVINFDKKDCTEWEAFLMYFFTTFFIMCVTFMSTVMHLFYWDVSYVFYYLKARFKGYQYLSSVDCIYDAFVTYDTQDPSVSDWVLNHLRVQLEEQGERYLPVCLEERDWVPGCPLLDSMTQSIQQSRKTVFVLTRNYINSGSFKMAVYLAHQRLLEESEDVIVLLLLEPVLQNSHFLRLRRRLCGQSVLEWPRAPAAEPWFWQSLRNAIRVDNTTIYSKIYSRYFPSRRRPEKPRNFH